MKTGDNPLETAENLDRPLVSRENPLVFTIKVQYSRADEAGPTFQFQRSAPLGKAIVTILYLPGSVEIERRVNRSFQELRVRCADRSGRL